MTHDHSSNCIFNDNVFLMTMRWKKKKMHLKQSRMGARGWRGRGGAALPLACLLLPAAGGRRPTANGPPPRCCRMEQECRTSGGAGAAVPPSTEQGGIQTRLVACCSPGPCPASAYTPHRRQACPCRRRTAARRCTLLRARTTALACCLPVTAAARRRQLEIAPNHMPVHAWDGRTGTGRSDAEQQPRAA